MSKSVFIKLSILLGFWFIVFLPIYPPLVHTWFNNSNNTHGLLVPFISAYIIWQKKETLKKITFESSKTGLFVLVTSLVVYIFAYLTHIAVISRAMIIFALIGIILFNLGKIAFWALSFPLLYLFFLVPIPDSILGIFSFPLQLFATRISEKIIGLFSIQVFREGNILYFAKTQLEVAEACSGLRAVMAFLTASFLFAYFMKKGKIKKIILIASAIPLALFANIVRVTGISFLAYFFDDKFARGFLHGFSGWVLFLFGALLFFAEYVILNKWQTNHS